LSFWFGLLLLSLSGGILSPTSHPDSQSLTEIWVADDHLSIHFEVQLESLAEVLDLVDPDQDGALSSQELLVSEASILAYLDQHLRLTGASGEGAQSSLPLVQPELTLMNRGEPLERDGRVWLEAAYRLPLDFELDHLSVTIDPFFETSPGHLSTLIVHWPDALPDLEILSRGQADWSGVRGASLRGEALREGFLVGLLGAAPLIVLLLAAGSTCAGWDLLVWFLAALLAPLWVTRLGFQLELRTLGLACAVGAVYLGSDVVLNPGARIRWLTAGIMGTAMGALLVQHPSLLPEVLAPASTRWIFLAAAPLACLLVALPLVSLARKHMTRVGWLVAVLGLVVFLARASGFLSAGC
jgi:hypothetical protein